MKIKALALSFCAVALGMHASVALSADAATTEPLQTIAALDVPRYMGTWYEIARYPNWFQKKCVGDTRADYSLQPDGRVQVINRQIFLNPPLDASFHGFGHGNRLADPVVE